MTAQDAYRLNNSWVFKGSYFVTGNVFESTNHLLRLNPTTPLPVSLNQPTVLFVDPTKN